MTIEKLASQFLDQGRYIRNWSPKTVRTYRQNLATLRQAIGDSAPTKASLNAFVIWMRERGLTPGGCNVRIRAVNSFLTWLRDEDHTAERLRIKVLRVERKSLTTFSDLDLRKLITFKPADHTQRRTWTMALLMLDCGLRIDEVMGLERANVDLDALVLKVVGKGAKERQVPISPECRKHLWRYLSRESIAGRFVFAARTGERLTYRNAYRDIARVCAAASVKGKSNPHNFRHCFSMNYIRNGGDLYRLSRILGHASVTTTQLYLRSMGVEHLQEGHAKLSPLGNLARSVSVVATLLVGALTTGCNSSSITSPSSCAADIVLAVSPADNRVNWLLPAGAVADAIQVRTPERTLTLSGSVMSMMFDPSVALSVRARVCGAWGEWASVNLQGGQR
jgi:integrase/recombinase XerD